ncbi:probable Golgi to ER traffic protein 4 [Saccharomycodes ludwigii]|uniref:Probable Golgi to ER traffic protein 4 n=1 Tax=Saccharomycodes ludwigii TaxID=36035 RepID=A0A376BA14_9ASCO|nr:hypothetical protein SCDLUD_000920 [Saccharomycodes ludwigii]KAH3903295.1 hypothetical protein SCDLUD_000920 [Saccharomycodes ludwigii]SSD61516.1 probable Golgi to ER traffic protein 4 [Saccharomycodes ludwigii]
MSNVKLAKTLERFETKIKDGHYYEAHQTLRTITNRYVRAKKYDDAIELLAKGAQLLIKAKQGGSATDLIFYLLEVYDLAKIQVDDLSSSRLVQLLSILDPQEPNLKDVITGVNNWSIKFGKYKFGDPYLHHIMSKKLLQGGYCYEAERYMVLATKDSIEDYVNFLWDWYLQAQEESKEEGDCNIADFYSRIILNYLFIFNIKFAYSAGEMFLTKFINNNKKKVTSWKIKKNEFELSFFPDYEELNFLELLLLTCQSGNKALFIGLKQSFPNIESKYSNELQYLGQEYFGIKTQKPVNFLQDMMSGLLGGGL